VTYKDDLQWPVDCLPANGNGIPDINQLMVCQVEILGRQTAYALSVSHQYGSKKQLGQGVNEVM
jgi:hypothetical protein